MHCYHKDQDSCHATLSRLHDHRPDRPRAPLSHATNPPELPLHQPSQPAGPDSLPILQNQEHSVYSLLLTLASLRDLCAGIYVLRQCVPAVVRTCGCGDVICRECASMCSWKERGFAWSVWVGTV